MTASTFNHAVDRGDPNGNAVAHRRAEAGQLLALVESARRARRLGLCSRQVLRDREARFERHVASDGQPVQWDSATRRCA